MKRKINFTFDKLIWAVIILLPIFAYLLTIKTCGSFENVFTNYGFGVSQTSVVYTTITEIFGVGANSGYLGVFSSPAIPLYITYLVNVELLHLLVDCLLFIPRIAQKYVNKGGDC